MFTVLCQGHIRSQKWAACSSQVCHGIFAGCAADLGLWMQGPGQAFSYWISPQPSDIEWWPCCFCLACLWAGSRGLVCLTHQLPAPHCCFRLFMPLVLPGPVCAPTVGPGLADPTGVPVPWAHWSRPLACATYYFLWVVCTRKIYFVMKIVNYNASDEIFISNIAFFIFRNFICLKHYLFFSYLCFNEIFFICI